MWLWECFGYGTDDLLKKKTVVRYCSGGKHQHLGGRAMWNSEFGAFLVYRASSRKARVKQKPYLQKTEYLCTAVCILERSVIVEAEPWRWSALGFPGHWCWNSPLMTGCRVHSEPGLGSTPNTQHFKAEAEASLGHIARPHLEKKKKERLNWGWFLQRCVTNDSNADLFPSEIMCWAWGATFNPALQRH